MSICGMCVNLKRLTRGHFGMTRKTKKQTLKTTPGFLSSSHFYIPFLDRPLFLNSAAAQNEIVAFYIEKPFLCMITSDSKEHLTHHKLMLCHCRKGYERLYFKPNLSAISQP